MRRNRAVLVCTAAAVFLAMLSHAEARIQRQRRQGFVAPLQPFSLVHSVVHIVAAQVVDNTLRILETAAVAPIQVAYYAPRRMRPRPPRVEPIEDLDDESVVRPIRVAYQMPERRLAIAPPSDAGDDYEQEQGDMSLRIETRGDRPTVAGRALLLGLFISDRISTACPLESVTVARWNGHTFRRSCFFSSV